MVGLMKQFLSVILSVFHVIFLLPVSSESININGTRGAPLLWTCLYTSTEPFYPKDCYIYWQGQHASNIVIHIWSKGKQESIHQTPSFRNRTQIFPDQLSSGNLSLVIEPLMLEDDRLSLEVTVSGNKPAKKLCQMTLYIAAPFQEPKIEINQTEMTATCSTKGGYPKPELKWSSGDGETGLKPQELATDMTVESDATYSVSSTVNITGFQKVTCTVYNPTSNQTLSATKDMSPDMSPANRHHMAILGVLIFIACMLLIVFLKNKICPNGNGNVEAEEREGAGDPMTDQGDAVAATEQETSLQTESQNNTSGKN